MNTCAVSKSNVILAPVKRDITVFYCNARSIRNKFNELTLKNSHFNYDIIAITETWLHTETRDSLDAFKLPGYALITKDRQGREGGGVLFYIRNELNFVVIDNEHNESLWLRFCDKSSNSFVLAVVYRSPDSTFENDEHIVNDIKKARNWSKVCILGDFNLPNIDWINMAYQGRNSILEAFLDNYFLQLVDEPTRQNNILDLVCCNSLNFVNDIEILEPLGESDHNSLNFKLSFNHVVNKSRTKIPIFKFANFTQMKVDILEWFEANPLNNIEHYYKSFLNFITELQNTHIPHKSTANKKRDKPWINKQLKNAIGHKRALFKRLKSNQCLLDEFKLTQRNIKRDIYLAKCRYENRLADIAKNEPKAFFQYYRAKNKESIQSLRDNDTLTQDDSEIAKILNNHFASVFNPRESAESDNIQVNNLAGSMLEIEISVLDVGKSIDKLKANKSAGVDGIYARTIKELKNEISPILTLIFNKFLTDNFVPSDWKLANVIPLFKKGSKLDKANYRPISLTSIIGKLFESVIVEKLRFYFESSNVISNSQHGFRVGRSCLTNLICFYDKVIKSVDQGKSYDIVFLDFSKAFDKIPHKKLISKLFMSCGNVKLTNWVENWLTDRKQRVVVNGAFSNWLSVTSGVPQGSVLGPVLFLVYINDLLKKIQDCNIGSYADDTKFGSEITSIDDYEAIQRNLDIVNMWCQEWNMQLNNSKCVVMHCGKNNANFTYKLGECVLNSVSEYEDLGVLVDNRLNFSKHCLKVRNKATSIIHFIKHCVTTRKEDTMVKLFTSLVRPVLDYCAPFWSPLLIKDIDVIEQVQRRFTRLINGCQDLTYQQRLEKLSLFSLEYRRKRGEMIETFKFVKYLPDTAKNLFSFSDCARTRGHAHKMVKTKFKTNLGANAFSNRVVTTWNALPNDGVEHDRVDTFKIKLDEILGDLVNLRY